MLSRWRTGSSTSSPASGTLPRTTRSRKTAPQSVSDAGAVPARSRPGSLPPLVGHGGGSFRRSLGGEVLARTLRHEVPAEGVDQRLPRGDVELCDVLVTDL